METQTGCHGSNLSFTKQPHPEGISSFIFYFIANVTVINIINILFIEDKLKLVIMTINSSGKYGSI